MTGRKTNGKKTKSGVAGAQLVAIIGGSGAGKTYLAARLQKKLGRKAIRLALDDFYRDRSTCPVSRRARINFDHPRAIDWEALESVLLKLASGQPAHAPQYDFTTHTRRAATRLIEPRPVVLVEGLWPCHRKTVRGLFQLRIYLDCPEKTRLVRRMRRDVPQRGRTRQAVLQQFFQSVAPMHDKFVSPQMRWSDVIVRHPMAARAVTRLAQTIEQLDNKGKI